MYVYTYIYVCVSMYTYVYTRINICINLFTHTRKRFTATQLNIHTHYKANI